MTRFAFTLLFILSVASLPLQVHAQTGGQNLQLAANSQTSLDAAVSQVKQQTGGRILSAKTVRKDNNKVHHIKVLLPSGKVRVFKVK